MREVMKLRREDMERRILRAQAQIAQAGARVRRDRLHQKQRRLGKLQDRLGKLEGDTQSNRLRLCFGSRRLWRKQHNLEINGYSQSRGMAHGLAFSARSDEFFVLGSRDETGGCQLCLATEANDGSLTLRVRLPDCLAGEQGKHLLIPGIRFKYGHEQVLAALESNAEYAAFRSRYGEQAARQSGLGQAVSYRFKRDARGWRVFVTTQMVEAQVVTDRSLGAIGVDLNADHLAVCEADASGNPVNSFRVPLVTYGKSQRQAEAIIGDAVASIVAYAREAGKPIVLEKLDFRQKKAVLEGQSPRYSRMLSSFSYAKVRACFLSRGIRQGVEVYQVNPGLQFGDRSGQVHGTLRAQRPPGGSIGAGPAFPRLFRRHPASQGCSPGQRGPCRLLRTCKEAGEARMDPVGMCPRTVETGACSTTRAGEAETHSQSGSGSGLNGDQFRVPG